MANPQQILFKIYFIYNNYHKYYKNMCFLKVTSLRDVQNHPSAFKKVESDHQQTESFDLEEDLKNSFQTIKKTNELTQMINSPQIESNQGLYYRISMMFNLINYNNSLTFTLLEKNKSMENNICVLQNLLDQTKMSKSKKVEQKSRTDFELDENNEQDKIIQKIFGNQKYRYQLVLDQPFNLIQYKERNFDLSLKLVDSENNIIMNSNPIPITFVVYSSDETPELIDVNKSGQSIFKGNSENQIYHGVSEFKKVHIKEVSSYFTHGCVNFVIYPKAPSFHYNNRQSSLEEIVDYTKIKPLLISDVIVRAKKK